MVYNAFMTKPNFSSLLDWLYPPTCISCKSLLPLNHSARYICGACAVLFDGVVAPMCERCGVSVPEDVTLCSSCYGKIFHFTYNRAAFPYDELIRDLMHEIKFRGKKRVAQGLGELWVSTIRKEDIPPEFILVPLPMHPAKQRERGFNQAEILANALSKGFNIPVENALVRTEDTPPQAGLHPKLRAENVRDVFAIHPNFDVGGKNYIIIDDIYTTGASLNECAKVLVFSGAAKVLCMTFAITVKNIDKV